MSSLRDSLQAIYDENGRLTPALVVDRAVTDETLHARLEWDDTVAGHRYRLVQAADLIRSVRVVYGETKEGKKSVRAYTAVFDADSTNANYMPTGDALLDPFTYQLVLRSAEREMKMFARRYRHLKEFGDIVRNALQDEAS